MALWQWRSGAWGWTGHAVAIRGYTSYPCISNSKICMFVWMCIYIYTYIHSHIYIYIICIYTHIYIYMCMSVYVYIYIIWILSLYIKILKSVTYTSIYTTYDVWYPPNPTQSTSTPNASCKAMARSKWLAPGHVDSRVTKTSFVFCWYSWLSQYESMISGYFMIF